jgi:cbb3-type cytochrome oxidase cytochrome c subunit
MSISLVKRLPSHRFLETHSIWLVVGIIVAIAIGGIVEIVPLFYLKNTIEQVEGVRSSSPDSTSTFARVATSVTPR